VAVRMTGSNAGGAFSLAGVPFWEKLLEVEMSAASVQDALEKYITAIIEEKESVTKVNGSGDYFLQFSLVFGKDAEIEISEDFAPSPGEGIVEYKIENLLAMKRLTKERRTTHLFLKYVSSEIAGFATDLCGVENGGLFAADKELYYDEFPEREMLESSAFWKEG